MAVWRWRAKLDGEILMMVDGTREGEASGGGFRRWKEPWMTIGWGLVGFSSNNHSRCRSFGFEL